jgi:hypothetical protein
MGNGCSMSADCSCSTTSDSTGVLPPRAPCASRKSGLLPHAKAAAYAYNKGTFNTRHMETLDLATLELLAAFEADLDVDLDAIDADEMLDDEA